MILTDEEILSIWRDRPSHKRPEEQLVLEICRAIEKSTAVRCAEICRSAEFSGGGGEALDAAHAILKAFGVEE